MTDEPPVRLREYDKDEWRRIVRVANPTWSDEDFDRAWDDFQEMKRRKPLN